MKKRVGERTASSRTARTFSEVVELTSRVSTDKVAEARRRLGVDVRRPREAGRLRDRDEHDLCRSRHPAAGADGGARSAEDARRVHPGDEPRRTRRHAARARRDAAQRPQAARPLALRALPPLPRDLLSVGRGQQRHAVLGAGDSTAALPARSSRWRGTWTAQLTPPRGVERIKDVRAGLRDKLLAVFRERVNSQPMDEDERAERERSVQDRIGDLLDAWTKIFDDLHEHGVQMQYQQYELDRVPGHLLHEMLEVNLERTNRSSELTALCAMSSRTSTSS